MTAIRASWLCLAVLAAGWSLVLGVPFWLSATALGCAMAPALVGFFLTGSATPSQTAEIESMLWLVLATAATASTGGVLSPLNIAYAIPIGLAWSTGDSRLTAEAGAFGMLGFVMAALAGASGTWLEAGAAQTLGATFGVCALAMTGLIAALGVARSTASPRPVVGPAIDPAHALKLRQAESRAAQAEAKLGAANAETDSARQKLEQRTRFFAQTSHELRTPLNAIIGFADMMRGGVFGALPDRYQEYAELIHEGGRNLELVVDDVLDLARMDAGKFEVSPEEVSLTDLAAEAVRFMSDVAVRKGIDLALADGEDAEAFADSRAVRQIALNLISNALKFTPEGGEVTVAAIETPSGSLLAVSDTGSGISEEELRRLSRAFEQGEEGRRQKGAGLGLSVVRAFAELHEGRLDIESRAGGGSTIAVFFPAQRTQPASRHDARAPGER